MRLIALDLRELWISFRLLLILGSLLASALAVVLASASTLAGHGSTTYAVALAAAAIVAAAAAAHAISADRRDGSAAWLAARAVSRSSLLLAWLAAFVPPLLLGLVASASVAWLTLSVELGSSLSPASFSLAVTGSAVGSLAAVSLGLMLGTLLPPWRAALLTGLLAVGAAVVTVLLPASTALPSGGFALLADLPSVDRPIGLALESIGSGLVAIGMLTAGAAAFMQQADL